MGAARAIIGADDDVKSCVSTPLLVQVILPTVGEAVQASFDLDPLHQRDVFATLESLLDRASAHCIGSLSSGAAAAEALDKLQDLASKDLTFLQDQFRLLDDWKAKAHEATSMLAKMRESYMKEVALLRSQLRKTKLDHEEPDDVLLFEATDFLLSHEVAQLISDSQLSACKEKMIAMQVQNTENLCLLHRIAEAHGYENEQHARSKFGDLEESSQANAESVISQELFRFRQDAERKHMVKLKQCQVKPDKPLLRRRNSAGANLPAETKPGGFQRRRSDPGSSISQFLQFDPTADSDSEDDEIVGLKARYEAKLRGKRRLDESQTVQKAKEKFLSAIKKDKSKGAIAPISKVKTKLTNESACQTDELGPSELKKATMQEMRTPFRSPLDFVNKGVNTVDVKKVDQGSNPVPANELLSRDILNEQDMSVDAAFTDNSSMGCPSPVESQRKYASTSPKGSLQGTCLPKCFGATKSDDAAGLGERGSLDDVLSAPYSSPFGGLQQAKAALEAKISGSSNATSNRSNARSLEPLQLELKRGSSLDGGADRAEAAAGSDIPEQAGLAAPSSPSSPSAKQRPRRRKLDSSAKAKFATSG